MGHEGVRETWWGVSVLNRRPTDHESEPGLQRLQRLGRSFTGPIAPHPLTSPLSLTFIRATNSDESGTVTVGYTVQPFQGAVCGQRTFPYTRP